MRVISKPVARGRHARAFTLNSTIVAIIAVLYTRNDRGSCVENVCCGMPLSSVAKTGNTMYGAQCKLNLLQVLTMACMAIWKPGATC